MEQKVFLCLECQTLFNDGENHMCMNIDKTNFISELGVGNKHTEGIHGSNSHVQYQIVSEIDVPNNPAAFSSSTDVEIQLHSETLRNICDGANSYLKALPKEHRDLTVVNASNQNKIFDLSLQPSHPVYLKGSAENNMHLEYLVDLQPHASDTRQTTNYSTVPGISSPACELKNECIESSITKSMVHNYTLTPILYSPDGLQSSNFSCGTSNGQYCATTDVNIRDFLPNTDSFKLELHEGMNERNILKSSSIFEATNCISKNSDFDPVQRHENGTSHLQRLHQVISKYCDIRRNKLADNDASLMSKSEEYHIAGPSHWNVEAYCDLQDGRFLCRLCGKSCSSKHKFIVYYRIHTGEKPYACNKCPKRFIKRIQLATHHKIHSVERPYACYKCTKRFKRKDKLKRHLLTHTVEKPYPCDKCDKSFVRKGQLAQHRLTHIGDQMLVWEMYKKFARKKIFAPMWLEHNKGL